MLQSYTTSKPAGNHLWLFLNTSRDSGEGDLMAVLGPAHDSKAFTINRQHKMRKLQDFNLNAVKPKTSELFSHHCILLHALNKSGVNAS